MDTMIRKLAFLLASLPFISAPLSAIAAQSPDLPAKIALRVPFVSEAPGNIWTGSWKNACEEASIAMLQYYYAGKTTETVAQSKAFMQMLFAKERKLWGSDANSDAGQTLKLIRDYSSFSGKLVENPTVEGIKTELAAGRPVILPLNGFELANPHIPFLRTGSGYHMLALIGYDDAKREFIANDVGDNVAGAGYRYGYDRIMGAIHDYDGRRGKTDGPSVAIFTYPKLAKFAGSHRIYFLEDGVKQYVSHPKVFAQKGWSWGWVNTVSDGFLAGFKDGAVMRP